VSEQVPNFVRRSAELCQKKCQTVAEQVPNWQNKFQTLSEQVPNCGRTSAKLAEQVPNFVRASAKLWQNKCQTVSEQVPKCGRTSVKLCQNKCQTMLKKFNGTRVLNVKTFCGYYRLRLTAKRSSCGDLRF
jgi:rRNA maturation protein Nop10